MIKTGKYIVAVSGGVDSVILLDMLVRQVDSKQLTVNSKLQNIELVVAHFNHGIRKDSAEDEKLVIDLAKQYGLDFVVGYGYLGAKVSEDQARQARYEFLEIVKADKKADGIITAHHSDDLLETAVANILRGTSGRGMQSMLSNKQIIRPLLGLNKQQILDYAKKHKLQWREDSTNQDEKYLRNYIRKNLLTKFDRAKKAKLHTLIYRQQKLVGEQDDLARSIIAIIGDKNIDRHMFSMLPHEVARQVMSVWLRDQDIADFDKATIDRLVIAAKSAKNNSVHDVLGDRTLKVEKDFFRLAKR